MTVEVRTDTGKFREHGLETRVDGQMWWIVIGFHNAVRTLYPAARRKTGLD